MPVPNPKQVAIVKKKLTDDNKKNVAILAKVADALKKAKALKATAAQTKTELGAETD